MGRKGGSMQEENIRKLGKLIKGIRVAMLTTAEDDGTLHSRPMATQHIDFDGDLWFFTLNHTAKVFEVKRHRQVNLSYSDPENQRYVAVSGRASVVRDREKARELWNPLHRAWFPKGLDDPELTLLKVAAEKAEYWDSPSAPVVQLIGFVKAMAAGKRYEPGENVKLDFER